MHNGMQSALYNVHTYPSTIQVCNSQMSITKWQQSGTGVIIVTTIIHSTLLTRYDFFIVAYISFSTSLEGIQLLLISL